MSVLFCHTFELHNNKYYYYYYVTRRQFDDDWPVLAESMSTINVYYYYPMRLVSDHLTTNYRGIPGSWPSPATNISGYIRLLFFFLFNFFVYPPTHIVVQYRIDVCLSFLIFIIVFWLYLERIFPLAKKQPLDCHWLIMVMVMMSHFILSQNILKMNLNL